MASSLLSGESLPRTSTAPGMDAAQRADSSLRSHQTTQGASDAFTRPATAAQRAATVSRLAR